MDVNDTDDRVFMRPCRKVSLFTQMKHTHALGLTT